jgi:hypothetical protein
MTAGDRSARAGRVRAPAGLRELAAAFDQMAARWTGRNRFGGDLVAAVAHELHAPIAVLQAGHEALLDGVAEPTPPNSARCVMRCCGWRGWLATCKT